MEDLEKQLEKKNIKPEDRKKLEQLLNLFKQQKNILIENETNKQKDEIINQNEINVQKMLEEEEAKRKKAEEEEAKRIEEEQKQEEAKKKIEGLISTNNIPSEKNIYRGQILYSHLKKNHYVHLTQKDGFYQRMYGNQMLMDGRV